MRNFNNLKFSFLILSRSNNQTFQRLNIKALPIYLTLKMNKQKKIYQKKINQKKMMTLIKTWKSNFRMKNQLKLKEKTFCLKNMQHFKGPSQNPNPHNQKNWILKNMILILLIQMRKMLRKTNKTRFKTKSRILTSIFINLNLILQVHLTLLIHQEIQLKKGFPLIIQNINLKILQQISMLIMKESSRTLVSKSNHTYQMLLEPQTTQLSLLNEQKQIFWDLQEEAAKHMCFQAELLSSTNLLQ